MTTQNAFHSNTRRFDFFYATGSSALNTLIAPQGAFRLIGARMKLSAVPTTDEDFVISCDNSLGVAYDVELGRVSPYDEAASSLVWVPSNEAEQYFKSGDQILFTFTNTDGNTYGIEVIVERLK